MTRTFGRHLRFLVPTEFESMLRRRTAEFTKGANGWSETVRQKGVFFDLSRVEWVDLGAVAHIVLLVEAALKDGIGVSVALPLARERRSEAIWMRNSESRSAAEATLYRIERRVAASSFLKYLQFDRALMCDHLRAPTDLLQIIEDYDLSSSDIDEDSDLVQSTELPEQQIFQPQREHLYKYYFPLTWISKQHRSDLHPMAKFLAGVIGESKRGLEGLDAKTIANVILYELVDNVRKHAETSCALVAASVLSELTKPLPRNYLNCERAYLDWFSQISSPLVDIIIGDSGIGIPSNLTDEFNGAREAGEEVPQDGPNETSNVMVWAFDRWSSSNNDSTDSRGTRGLYRVDRVVKKYQGLISIRGDKQLVGWDHGGPSYDKRIYSNERLKWIPGTVLRLRMPAHHQGYLPWRITSNGAKEQEFEAVQLGAISPSGMSLQSKERLRSLLLKAGTNKHLCVLGLLTSTQVEQQSGSESVIKQSVEAVIKQSLELRHPGALILYGLPGGWALVENAIDSINSEHINRRRSDESISPENFEVWDPVLILGERGEYAWAGVTQSLKIVLDALLKDGGRLSLERIEELVPDVKERTSIIRQLRNDTNLVTFRDDQSIEVRFNFSEIFNPISKLLVEYINGQKNARGILTGGVFRTPSLLLVNKWLNVKTVVDATCGMDLAAFALSARLREDESWKRCGPANIILTDSSVHSHQIDILGSHLGIKRKESLTSESEGPIPPGVRVIAQNAKVLIYSDIILSSESLRNCLRQTLRDGAIPVAIACLLDARKDSNNPIELWEMKVPVIKLADIDIIVEQEPRYVSNISPVTKELELSRRAVNSNDYKIPPDSLHNLIQKYGALHFSHIGRPIGRHFTFYLDATQFIDEPLINRSLDEEIGEWIGHNNEYEPKTDAETIELWHPEPEPKPSSPARRFADRIESHRADVKHSRVIRREPAYGRWFFTSRQGTQVKSPNVVIIDWGALTGTTVIQMIRLAAEAGAERVLVCVILSQLPIDEERFLRRLNVLKVPVYENEISAGVQSTLPGFTVDERIVKRYRHPVVTVKFISRFQVEAYGRHECPVCQQLVRLSQEEDGYPTELLSDFALRQKEDRLYLRKREQMLNSQPQDFDGNPLSNDATIKMAAFREVLFDALLSTGRRNDLFLKLKEINESLSDAKPMVWEDASLILHFLSIETQWLRKPPLYFQKLRDLIANISIKMAANNEETEMNRLNAIVVLRTSSKYLFARNIEGIFRSVATHPLLVEQLLYGIFTYASRPYHQSPGVLKPIREGLKQIKTSISERHVTVSDHVGETVDRLLSRVERIHATANVAQLDVPNAWLMLRQAFEELYLRKHNPVPDNMVRMQPWIFTEDIERAIDEFDKGKASHRLLNQSVTTWLKHLNDCWTPCCSFLDNTALPLIGKIKDILDSDDGKRAVGPDTITKLKDLCESKVTLAESDFSKLVTEFSKNPLGVLNRQNWITFKLESEWYWDKILKGGEFSSPSGIIRFLMSAPAELGTVFMHVNEEMQINIPYLKIEGQEELIRNNPKVFCTKELLRDVFLQIIGNVDKHRVDDSVQPAIHVDMQEAEDRILLIMNNNLTEEGQRHGEGISQLKERLRPFAASIRTNLRPTDTNWSFSVELEFLRGV